MATHRIFFVIQNWNQMIYSAILCFSFRFVPVFFFNFEVWSQSISIYMFDKHKKLCYKNVPLNHIYLEDSAFWKKIVYENWILASFWNHQSLTVYGAVRFNAYSHVEISKAKCLTSSEKKKLFSNPFVEFWVGLECLHMC